MQQNVDSHASPELGRAVQRSEAERGGQDRLRGDQFKPKAVVLRGGAGTCTKWQRRRELGVSPLCCGHGTLWLGSWVAKGRNG